MNAMIRGLCIVIAWLAAPVAQADSYRYMHVSIETPWTIFLFLLVMVLSPFILMAILYWRNAVRRNREAEVLDGDERRE